MIDLDVELKRMGKGWFILQLALEYGVKTPSSTDYGTKLAMNTRTNTFERTKNVHHDMLGHLLNNWDKRISGGNPVVSNIELYDIAIAVFKLM